MKFLNLVPFLNSFKSGTGPCCMLLCFSMMACGPGTPENTSAKSDVNCSGSALRQTCTYTSGGYDRFTIGMNKEMAFEIACEGFVSDYYTSPAFGEINSRPYPNSSICELRNEALASDYWTFIRQSNGNRIRLSFSNELIKEIMVGERGWDM